MIWVTTDTHYTHYILIALVLQWHLFGSSWFIQNHGITEWFGLEEIPQFQPPNSPSNILCSLVETKVLLLWCQILVEKSQTNPKFPLLQSLLSGAGRSSFQSSVWWERGGFLQIGGLEWSRDPITKWWLSSRRQPKLQKSWFLYATSRVNCSPLVTVLTFPSHRKH